MALEELGGENETPKAENTSAVISQEQYAAQQKELEFLKEQMAQLLNNGTGATTSSTNDLEAVIRAIKEKTDEEKYGSDGQAYVASDDMDPDDIIEDGVPFYCHGGGYYIADDKRKGRNVATPFRQGIMFTIYSSKRTGSGRDVKQENIARYVSYSKKEVKWLRESSFYGWKIFDDIKVATSAHAKLAFEINKNYTAAKGMPVSTLISECKKLGIEQSTDLENMRLTYATAQAEIAQKRHEDDQLLRSKNAAIEGQMVKDSASLVSQ